MWSSSNRSVRSGLLVRNIFLKHRVLSNSRQNLHHNSSIRFASAASPTLRVQDVLAVKRKIQFTIEENVSLDDAISHLVKENASSSLAMDSKGQITGIFTARDLLRNIHLINTSSSNSSIAQKTRLSTKVKDIMTSKDKLVYCSPLDSVKRCREIMFQVKIRNIPVIQDGVCLGIINIKDLADSSFSVADTGGKKGFIHNISGRRGLPLGTVVNEDPMNGSDAEGQLQQQLQHIKQREVTVASHALPHPFKNSDDGQRQKRLEFCNDLSYCEDAHFAMNILGRSDSVPPHAFICVADGVGSWKSYGVDPRLYSRKLVENAKRIVELDSSNRSGLNSLGSGLAGLFDKEPPHPLDVMVDAFQMTLHDKVVGSCCVCVAHIDPQRMQLSYSNLGDCGLMVIRHIDSDKAGYMRERQLPRDKRTNDLKIAYLSQQQLKSFNRPFQLGFSTFPEHAGNFQLPIEADSASIPIMEGDIVVVASDGLFDNVELDDIVNEVSKWEKEFFPEVQTSDPSKIPANRTSSHSERAMNVLARRLVEYARTLSLDKDRDSPFAVLAKENDIMWGGGMPDDTTVVVARIAAPNTTTSFSYE